ncbi:MAG TPA: MMPL family transporter [Xanthobacteraceae bacterium]
MLQAYFARLAAFCIRYAPLTLIVAVLVAASSAVYVARHFSINTNINTLLSAKLPWHQREEAFSAAFPQQADSILAVITAPTPEFAGAAAANLAGHLAQQKGAFRSVDASQTSEFFSRAALLYLSQEDVASRMQKLGQAAPLIRILASDQSLRGLAHALSLSLGGLQTGHYALDDLARPLNTIADSLEQVLAGKPATFSWQVLLNNAPAKPADLMSLINIWPKLDYSSIEPGQKATEAVRKAVEDSKIGPTYDATVRLTGTVALADLQFSTLHEGVALNFAVTGLIIVVVLWLALRSIRIVVAVCICILVGLLATAALGLLLAGAFNPISVAFAVLFVGLGADFAIQYSVRYRAQRHELHDLKPSLVGAARLVGAPLTLAALAAAAGFLSFVPTDYRGVAELGLIAGVGMMVAYIVSLTLLPVLLWYFAPAGEPEPLGYAALAGADRFLHRHRIFIVVGTSLVALAGLPFLFHLQFNFDPNSLQNPNAEAIVALRLLNSNPNVIVSGADVLTEPKDAPAVVKRVSALPEVGSTRNLNSFIPTDQEAKIKLVAAASGMIDPALTAAKSPPPSDSDDVAALRTTAKDLQDTAGEGTGAGASAANRLAKDINRLADGDAQTRQKAAATFITPLQINLQQLSLSLHPQQVTRANLPADLVGQWMTKNGQMRTQIVPKGDANDSNTLQRFAEAVLKVEPDATGVAIETYEWGRTVTAAFAKAGILALCSIAILLWLVLRRIGDMLLTLIPLLVAAAVTLEICGLTGFQINYANIIALPALLGVGVAFKIYYVMAWRAGEANFLESVLTRAVFFSAVMTATAFGSLWFSSNPGISSMGKLLALSLACTLASAALFQPALMGPPRKKEAVDPDPVQLNRVRV